MSASKIIPICTTVCIWVPLQTPVHMGPIDASIGVHDPSKVESGTIICPKISGIVCKNTREWHPSTEFKNKHFFCKVNDCYVIIGSKCKWCLYAHWSHCLNMSSNADPCSYGAVMDAPIGIHDPTKVEFPHRSAQKRVCIEVYAFSRAYIICTYLGSCDKPWPSWKGPYA
jgi:hypothetical protein